MDEWMNRLMGVKDVIVEWMNGWMRMMNGGMDE